MAKHDVPQEPLNLARVMTLKGGMRRMIIDMRLHMGLPRLPSGGVWDIKEFVNKYNEMGSMKPPKVAEKVIGDFGPILLAPGPLDSGVSSSECGGGGADDPVPTPSCGGPAYPIDAEEAALAAELRKARMRDELAELKAKDAARLEGRAPAFGGGASAGATISPVATGEAVRAGKSGILSGVRGDEKVSAIESIDVDA